MALRKDDPVYYKDKIIKLIKQAKENGLKVRVTDCGIGIKFIHDNGEIAAVHFTNII